MDTLLNQLLDQFEAGLMDRTMKVMRIAADEKYSFPMELKQEAVCSNVTWNGRYDDI